MAGITQGLDVHVVIGATFSEWHDVITHRREFHTVGLLTPHTQG
jgi:hypothetical protein